MGVENIITFDAHDPRVQNAIPLSGFESIMPTYQMLKAMCHTYDDLRIDKHHMMVISPDEGALNRACIVRNPPKTEYGIPGFPSDSAGQHCHVESSKLIHPQSTIR